MTQYKMPGDHVISVNHNFGAISDSTGGYYSFPISDNPNGVTGTGGYMGLQHELEKPQIRYTWYDRYLWKRYEEMRRLANEEYATLPYSERRNFTAPIHPIRADVVKIDRYTTDFYERYLRNRRYYRGNGTERE